MPIEFRCTRCNRLLRTQEDAAGKQARCPECGTILDVPGRSSADPQAEPGAASPASQTPFAAGTSPAFGADAPGQENPYQTPGAEARPGYPFGRPSIQPGYVPNYLVQAILCTLFCCIPFGIVAIVFAAQVNGHLAAGNFAAAQEASQNARIWCWVSFALGVIPALLGVGWFVLAMMAAIAGGL